MSPGRRTAAGLDRFAAPLLRVMSADSIEGVLGEAAALVAALAGARTAAAFTIEGDCAIHEGWYPEVVAAGDPLLPQLRGLAIESARTGTPIELPRSDASASTRAVLLKSQGRTLGAIALVTDGASQAGAGADAAEFAAREAEIEMATRLIAEAVTWQRRNTALRVTSDQQERWFRQLDHQVRVLDRERQKFAAVVNQSDIYVFVTDLSSTIGWVNRTLSVRPAPGAAGAEWTGRSCRDVCSTFSSAAEACQSCPVARALQTNGPVHHEFRDSLADRARTLYLSALPIKGMDGRAQEVLVMMQDLTDLETLRESEERYRVVTQAASDGIVTIDEQSRMIFVNDAMQRMFGYTNSQLVGQPLTMLMPPEFAARHLAGFQAYLVSGERQMAWEGVQLPARHRSGREIIVEMSFGEYSKEGKRLFTGVMRDITDRRRAEVELKRAQAQLRVVVSHSPIVLFAVDREGRFTLSEGRGLGSLGLTPGESVGQSVFELYAGVPRIVENIQRALAGEEFTDVVDVGPIGFETRYTPMRDEQGEVAGVIGVASDITERRRLEIQLRQSQKMEAVGRLAGGVAHDFNNLLTTILGYSTLLLQRHESADEPDRRLVEIKRAAERAAGLTRQLLAFSRRQVVEPRVSDLNRVVAEIEEMLRRLIGEDIDLVFTPAPAPAMVKADPGQLEQVLMNLAVNARDAMPRGGRLSVEIAVVELREPLEQGDITLRPGPCVTLSVRDTGCGMEPETLARIFEPFFTSKDFGQGTGLGLAIVYGIVQQSGGHIVAASEPGAGSSFTLYLPVAAARADTETAAPGTKSNTGTETLLLVEDEKAVRRLAREMLAREGYTVFEAANGAEALTVFEGHRGGIDLVITDVVMPGMSGGELVEHLLRKCPTLRVLYISGYTDDAIVRNGVSHSDSAFLQKPFSYETFVSKVREVLDRPPARRDAPPPERKAA